MGKTSAAVHNRYNAKTYDRVSLVLRKDSAISKEATQAAAAQAGQSLNAYIAQAIQERMERDGIRPHNPNNDTAPPEV